ncbi:hypothetical protein CLV46_1538 [Diaminobutyricimonas aerilata]|uniref:Transcription factor zinc-finger domain-containing protein n=1 Tax=Diaminobutyricimonas aerilata TaxID=1162967 RepID=A0A2M9CJ95_9MICO|nr:zf-TFIIB domain-containing protein [Diaminobutyricimonas aerilata]PJJ71979.1 hypothetical protein CLV46_1538 [Diaminobutyricimonas aerilata]
MKCPNDGATLVMSDRSGVEIDYCPECRGVWLDRGELDKIIDRAGPTPTSAPVAPAAPAYQQPPAPQYAEPRYETPRYDPRYGQSHDPYRRKKKDNWLSELFD